MTQENRPESKPRYVKKEIAEGDLYWVDADSSIRVVKKCQGCGKLVLSEWVSKPVAEIKCGKCSYGKE